MNNRTTSRNLPAFVAGILAFALSATAFAGLRTLPTPPQSEFADAESSAVVALPVNEGRHIRLTVAFDPSPTNAVMVAFGDDANGDEDLGPEETQLVVGCDCGEWFVREEGLGRRSRSTAEWSTDNNCVIRQPKSRWSLAKVTTHNVAATNVVVTAKFYNKGLALLLR